MKKKEWQFWPNREAARFESDKIFAKEFMDKYGIPPGFNILMTSAGKDYILKHLDQCVVSGWPCGGQGFLFQVKEEALDAVDKIMVQRSFGGSGDKIVVEELLERRSASLHLWMGVL